MHCQCTPSMLPSCLTFIEHSTLTVPTCVQELHQIAQGLLSNLLRNLCTYQVDDTFAAPVPAAAPGEPGSLSMEPWLPERYGSLDADVRPPAWREPGAEQVLRLSGFHLCFCNVAHCMLLS